MEHSIVVFMKLESFARCLLLFLVKKIANQFSSVDSQDPVTWPYLWDTAGLWNDSRSKAHMMLFI